MHDLVRIGIDLYNDDKKIFGKRHQFTNDDSVDEYFNDIEKYAHIFVLGCLMDKQIKAEKAWRIPYDFCTHFGSFNMIELAKIPLDKVKEYFSSTKPHRF